MKRQVLDYITKRGGGVSMVELCRDIPEFAGELDMFSAQNVVLWTGVSEAAIQALRELIDEKLITGVGTGLLVYLVDGGVLRLPIAKSPTTRYKKPHWWPIAFSLVPTQPHKAV